MHTIYVYFTTIWFYRHDKTFFIFTLMKRNLFNENTMQCIRILILKKKPIASFYRLYITRCDWMSFPIYSEFNTVWLSHEHMNLLCNLGNLISLSILPLFLQTSINKAELCRLLNLLLHFPSSTFLFTFPRITRVKVLGAPASVRT